MSKSLANLNGKSVVLGLGALGAVAVGALNYYRHTRKYCYSRRESSFDVYKSKQHGQVHVPTPYAWLEDPNSAETRAWVDKQNHTTDAYLETCPYRAQVEDNLKKLNNFEKFSCPFRRGARIFHFWNPGLLNHSVLRVQENADAPIETLLDPNTFAADGTAALSSYSISDAGRYLAYAVSRSGSDWCTIHVRDIATRKDLSDDKLEWVKFSSLSFDAAERGFFYCRYPAPRSLENELDESKRGQEVDAAASQSLYYHRIGTPQSEDVLIVNTPEQPTWMFGAEVTDDGRYCVITVVDGCDPVNKVWLLDMQLPGNDPNQAKDGFKIHRVIDSFAAGFDYVANDGPLFYFKTNHRAPRYKVVAVDMTDLDALHARATTASKVVEAAPKVQLEEKKDAEEKKAEDDASLPSLRTVVSEHPAQVLKYAYAVATDRLLCCHLRDVQEVLTLRPLAHGDDVTRELPLPAPGTIGGIGGRRADAEFYFSFTSFTYPSVIFRYDTRLEAAQSQQGQQGQQGQVDQALSVWKEVLAGELDPNLFQVKQVFYPSKDGTKIPMYLIHRKDLVLDGNNACLLYGYGGFNISLMPSFAASRLLWVQNFNAVYAIANLRGGGEYGEEWHKDGSLLNKQNVFDDFQHAAQYLISNKYTSAAKLGIQGGSNGGLLVGACINQRPDLFGAAVGQVGVMDMLKYHKFTIGYAWKSDYGDPEDPVFFDYLRAYSPAHNVDGTKSYPSVLLTTADHDDRVVPNHSYKYIAELQHQLGEAAHQTRPLLIRIETKAGHGAGKPLTKQIAETAVVFSFLAKSLGATWRD